MPRDVGDQRHYRLLELGEDRLELVGRQTWLIAIQQCVVRSVLVPECVGDPAVELDVLFESWHEQLEVRLAAGLLPNRTRGRPCFRYLRDELGESLLSWS